jgi:hypothetical protein
VVLSEELPKDEVLVLPRVPACGGFPTEPKFYELLLVVTVEPRPDLT